MPVDVMGYEELVPLLGPKVAESFKNLGGKGQDQDYIYCRMITLLNPDGTLPLGLVVTGPMQCLGEGVKPFLWCCTVL